MTMKPKNQVFRDPSDKTPDAGWLVMISGRVQSPTFNSRGAALAFLRAVERGTRNEEVTRPAAPARCPECGGALTIDTEALTVEEYHPGYHVTGTPLPRRTRRCTAAFCGGCEFAIEVR